MATFECEMWNSPVHAVVVSDCFANIVHLVAYIYMLTSNEEMSKIDKNISLKTSTSFSSPWRTNVFNKGFVLPDKLNHLSQTRVLNARGRPGVR